MKKIRYYLYLHLLFLMYSLGAVCSKAAGREDPISIKFFLFYGMTLLDLFLYAIIWQKILKRLPLATAYANKAVTVIWGLIWGALLFKETVTTWNLIGAVLIIFGIGMVVKADEDGN